MKKCVILSMDNPEAYEVYDHLIEAPLAELGWRVETLSWRARVNWNNYDLVMIRSPWDYQLAADEFLKVLEAIEASSAHLDNPLEIVEWNINKGYLKTLESKGVLIIPTLWRDDIQLEELEAFFDLLKADEIVIKPCISAGAFDTFRLNRQQAQAQKELLVEKYQNRQAMIQPFVPQIVSEGEYSLFYFDDEFSHAILKTPKQGDFRVQEEWGGRLLKVDPEPQLLAVAAKTIDAIGTSLLYTRLDFVRTEAGFALIEAELIEPSLYFNMDDESPKRFASAVERRMQRLGVVAASG